MELSLRRRQRGRLRIYMIGWPACLLRWGDVEGREDEGEEEEHYKDRGGGTAHCAGLQMLVLGCWCSDVQLNPSCTS